VSGPRPRDRAGSPRLAGMDEARVKIVATLGPASWDPRGLVAMARAGADVFRVNGAHTPPEEVAAIVRRVRAASRRAGREIAVLLDLPGIKLRCGHVPGGEVELRAGETVRLVRRAPKGPGVAIPVPSAVLSTLERGREVLLADGTVVLRVTAVRRGVATSRVVASGTVRDHAGVHVRGARHPGPALTPRDLRLADAGVRAGVDALAVSFVRSAADLRRLRRHVERGGRAAPLLVAKIERREAVEAIEDVLEACDGAMVARGDLGLEYGPEEVPGLQKRVLEACSRAGRFAITATQMLESMTHALRPTRAEASDVANAVFDGSDAVMLSGETAVGEHPVETVATMNRIVLAAEADPHCPFAGDPRIPGPTADARRPDRLVVRAAVRLATDADAAAVVVFTRGGQSARRVAKERPRAPVFAYAAEPSVVRGLLLSWGVRPRHMPARGSTDGLMGAVLASLRRDERLSRGDRVVLVMGGSGDPASTTTLIRLLTL